MHYGKEETKMARKKKTEEPVYIVCNQLTCLTKIAVKTGIAVEELRKLNPDIRFCLAGIRPGQKVRIR